MLFFTSDLHFGSEQTIKFDKRPFKNAKDFQNKIIKNWNKNTSKNDTIYVIGDFSDCHSNTDTKCIDILHIVKKIKAKVILILGNNEKRIIKYFFNNSFEQFKDYCKNIGFYDVKENDIVTIDQTSFYLTHKPKDHNPDMLNLFGHSHKAMGLYKSFGFNIGCDLNNYNLYNQNDIINLISKKQDFWDRDDNLKLI